MSISQWIDCLPQSLLFRLSHSSSIEGVDVAIFGKPSPATELLKIKVGTSLGLIRANAPKQWRRVRKFIPKILVFGSPPYNAAYYTGLGLCDIALEYAFSDKTTPVDLAMALVHEATHGYLHSRRIPYSEGRRARIERICVASEIAFARRFPASDAIIAEARRRLDYGPEYWTDRSFARRDMEALKSLGCPQFIVRWFERRLANRLKAAEADKAQHGAAPDGGLTKPAGGPRAPEGPPSAT